MFNQDMDERMLYIRGKAALWGFIFMIVSLLIKDFAIDIFNLYVEDTTRFDMTLIYSAVFLVLTYMLKKHAVSERVILVQKRLFPLPIILFLIVFLMHFIEEGNLNITFINNLFLSIFQCLITIYYCILLYRHQPIDSD